MQLEQLLNAGPTHAEQLAKQATQLLFVVSPYVLLGHADPHKLGAAPIKNLGELQVKQLPEFPALQVRQLMSQRMHCLSVVCI